MLLYMNTEVSILKYVFGTGDKVFFSKKSLINIACVFTPNCLAPVWQIPRTVKERKDWNRGPAVCVRVSRRYLDATLIAELLSLIV